MKRTSNTKIVDTLKGLKGDYVIKAGWFENSKYSNGMPIAAIAAVQNYGATINHPGGTPFFMKDGGQAQFVSLQSSKVDELPKTKPHTIVIPPTHFMEKAFGNNKDELIEIAKDAYTAVILGKETEQSAMNKLGFAIEGAIAKTITEINDPPLKPGTIKARQNKYKNKKKKGSLDKRLVATGEMLDALSHSVEKL